jgi:hypothetical protein
MPLLSGAAILSVGIGAPLLLYKVLGGYMPDFPISAAVAIVTAGLAYDATIALHARWLSLRSQGPGAASASDGSGQPRW